MHCYAQYSENKAECKNCKYLNYCKDSLDIPLLINSRGKKLYDNKIQATPIARAKAFNSDKKEFSKAEMLELIAFMVSLDETTIELLSEKLNDPTISIAELGKRRKITRQGVHKYIKQRCEQHPELAVIFQNKQNKHRKNFMEVVCKIKQQTLNTDSKRIEQNLSYSSSLICLSQSLDLSRMSIGKGIRS
ncbi:MAG: hypothetical protein IJW31_06570 [Lentisphaeria bacterium]|nr:hypothetical protein [Lentisphaeria bacterium]